MDLFLILRYCAPVGLAALGEVIHEKAGSINIGLEGMMLSGAFFAAWVSLATGNPWWGLAAGTLSALALMVLQCFFTIRLAIDQVVVGTATNLLALGLTGTLFRANFSKTALSNYPTLPKIGPLDPLLIVAIVLVPVVWWLLQRTKWGLAARATGEYPEAVVAAGFGVRKIRWQAAGLAGLLAGLAGSYLTLGFSGSFTENMTAGRGFVAIAMVTFGRWKPQWVFAGALLVGWLEALQFTLQSRSVQLPYQLMNALPYLAALAVLVIVGRGRGAPAALGIPWRRP
ncbi:MAG TPA: ABC transporter permease [Fimbriimonadaceae bacterium]|nr:ABC transporter permease [Fimbriimonadaceae bacterium]HRJ33036.1 ABC transporter permease [Fimbriimonadaceae bacterium]